MAETTYKRNAMINVALSSLGATYFGYSLAVFNPILEFLKSNVFPDASATVITMMTSMIPVGAGIGAVVAGSLLNKLGRRLSVYLTDLLSIIATILSVIEEPSVILIGRLLTGFCVGLNSAVVPLYNGEMSITEIKATTEPFFQLFNCVGMLVAYLLGVGTPTGSSNPESQWWRIIILVSIILNVGRSGGFLLSYNYDTPQYLITHGKDAEAREVLMKMYGTEERVNFEFNQIKNKKKAEQASKLTYSELFSDTYKGAMIVGIGLSVLQQLSGVNCITFYSTDIFRQGVTDPNDSTPQINTFIVGIINVFAALAAKPIIAMFQKKKALLIGTIATLLCLGSISVVSWTTEKSPLTKYLIFAYMFFYGFSLGTITWMLVGQILPDLGIGIAVLSNWTVAFIVAQVFPSMIAHLGLGTSFIFFFGFCVIGVFFIMKYVPDYGNEPETQKEIDPNGTELQVAKDMTRALLLEDLKDADMSTADKGFNKLRGKR